MLAAADSHSEIIPYCFTSESNETRSNITVVDCSVPDNSILNINMEKDFEFVGKDSQTISIPSHIMDNKVKEPSFQVISRVISDIDVRDEFPLEAMNIKFATSTDCQGHQESSQSSTTHSIFQKSISPPAAMKNPEPDVPTVIKQKKQSKKSGKKMVDSKVQSMNQQDTLVQQDNIDSAKMHFIPKTAKQYILAANKVSEFLEQENKGTAKGSRKRKAASDNMSSKETGQLDTPEEPPFHIGVYVAAGILPWHLKNEIATPKSDEGCQHRIPECIKKSILQHRKWHPTVTDKLYCFENHSHYLVDLELFGCWECIRKNYNENYKWGAKTGLVTRRR